MVAIKIRHLVEKATGFPELGNVNFSALQCLLTCLVEKLGITEDVINYDQIQNKKVLRSSHPVSKLRLIDGFDPEDYIHNEQTNKKQSIKESQQKEASKDYHEEEITKTLKEDQQMEVNQMDRQEVIREEAVPKDTTAKGAQEPIKELQESISMSGSSPISLETLREDLNKAKITVPPELLSGISIIKKQLDFAIEQLLLVTFITLSKKPDSQQIQKLHSMAQTLNKMKVQNMYTTGSKQTASPFVLSLNWLSSNLKLTEELPEKKSKDITNEISAHLLNHENQHLATPIQKLEKQIRNIKLANVEMKKNYSRLEMRTNQYNVENLKITQEKILRKMVDKTDFKKELANKVDYAQLQKKVSLDQFANLQCRIDKRFSEILKRISDSEKKFPDISENLKDTFDPTAIVKELSKFKDDISQEMKQVNNKLENYMAATNNDCAAAGTRLKMLQNLICLSCYKACGMPVREKSKVAKLPSAPKSSILNSLITSKLSSVRKSGLTGYYRKDEFPRSPNARLSHQSPSTTGQKHCVPRQAGGQHTTNTAKVRFQKITQSQTMNNLVKKK